MKIKSLVAAIALSAIGSQAIALAPGTAIDEVLTISGATAADRQFQNYVTQICDPATLDTFEGPVAAVANTCTVNNGNGQITVAGLPSPSNVLINKASGGSLQGVGPLVNFVQVPAITVAAATCTARPAPDDNEWDCTTSTTVDAELGISDVEPELFTIPANVRPGTTAPTAASLSNLTNVNPVNAQTFGVVVTPALRDALQAAQGLVVGSDEVDEMPSLSSAVIANIFTGNVAQWSTLVDASGNGIITPDATAAGADSVNLCVRTPGSGTQAQFNAFYMKNACAYRGASSFQFVGFETLGDTSTRTPPAGELAENDIDIPDFFGPLPAPYSHWNEGSSDMGRCLTNLAAAGRNGIGIQSLEKVDEGRTNRNNFKYLAIDGVTPTLENVKSGLYRNWATLSLQWGANVDADAGKLALAQQFVTTAQDFEAVRTFNISLQTDDDGSSDNRPASGFNIPEIRNAAGTAPANVGTLALATAANVIPATGWTVTQPILPQNTFLSNPSACAVPRVAEGAPLDVTAQN